MTPKLARHLAVLLLLAVATANSQDGPKDIRKLLADQVDAWNKGDIEGFMRGYWNSDSTTFVSDGNILRGHSAVVARYKKSYDTREKMGRLEFSELSFQNVDARAVIASGVWRLTRVIDQPWGRFTLIIERKPEGWRIVYDHTSTAKESK